MSGRAAILETHRVLAELARRQHQVLSRRQLAALGVAPRHVTGHLHARRWQEPVPGVVVLHRGPLTHEARRWVAVLAAGPASALGSWSTLALLGLTGWERPGVHIVVRRGRHVPAMHGVVVHESRRHGRADIEHHAGLPTHRLERAAVDAAAWSRSVRSACGLMAAVVQQRLTTPERLRVELDAAGRVRYRKQMFRALADVEGGSQALSEIDFLALCRRAGLPEPARQRMRLDTQGRQRYLDVEWRLPGGEVVVAEIDGIGHIEARRWYDDLLREAELVLPDSHRVIRLPASAVRLEPQRVLDILTRALHLSARRAG